MQTSSNANAAINGNKTASLMERNPAMGNGLVARTDFVPQNSPLLPFSLPSFTTNAPWSKTSQS